MVEINSSRRLHEIQQISTTFISHNSKLSVLKSPISNLTGSKQIEKRERRDRKNDTRVRTIKKNYKNRLDGGLSVYIDNSPKVTPFFFTHKQILRTRSRKGGLLLVGKISNKDQSKIWVETQIFI